MQELLKAGNKFNEKKDKTGSTKSGFCIGEKYDTREQQQGKKCWYKVFWILTSFNFVYLSFLNEGEKIDQGDGDDG